MRSRVKIVTLSYPGNDFTVLYNVYLLYIAGGGMKYGAYYLSIHIDLILILI